MHRKGKNMKNYVKIIALALLAVMVITVFASCGSSFGAIKRNFENNGYKYVENEDGNGIFDAYVAELEKGEISVTLHVFKAEPKEDGDDKGLFGGLISGITNAIDYCGVIEFGSDADMNKALEENATLSGLIKDVSKSDLVNGNCILVTGVVNIEEKIEIFTKSK